MKLRIIIFTGLLLCLTQIVLGKEPDWLQKIKSITLLSSTREDVKRTFRQPVITNPERKEPNQLEYFDINEGRISVLYSNGKCIKKVEDGIERVYGWQVPEWTVVDLDIHFNKPMNFKELKVNLSKFRSYKENDNTTKYSYNHDLGIEYSFWMSKFTGMSFKPPTKLYYLSCK